MIYQTNTTICDWMWLLNAIDSYRKTTLFHLPKGAWWTQNGTGGFLQVIGVEKLRRRTNGDWLERPGFSNDTEHLLVRLFVESTIWIFFFFFSSSSSSSWLLLLLFHFCRPCPNHCCFNCQCQSLKAWTAMRRSTDVCRPDHQAITKLPLRRDTRTPPRSALWRIPLISSSVTRGRACGEGRLGGLNILGLFGALKLEIHGLTAIPSAGEVSHPAISDDQKLHGSAVLLGFLEG